ncbi:ribonuclease HII [Kocuria tytonis]|uniref:ribonuclease HII n=1 Tax=Kocuria tytonis TaxID=2054280 RepID=UPI0018F6A820|nr:ribonuclease HII [Kocuria tytonis]
MSPARSAAAPTLALERELSANGARFVAGMDEVGRGALAGPASVGLVVLDVPALPGEDPESAPPPTRSAAQVAGRSTTSPDPAPYAPPPWEGIRDSKALSAARRAELAPGIGRWAAATAVGHAQPHEIDELGITAALRLAGLRALAAVRKNGARVDALILDGSHNWLDTAPVLGQSDSPVPLPPVVRTLVRADSACVSVAAASVLAKVERDALMVELDAAHPEYGWASNKGYGSAAHRAALADRGVTPQHRRSWNLGAG